MVTGPAYGNQCSSSALQFTKALLACGHNLESVFFYQEGVYNANSLTLPASDEIDIVRAWQDIAHKNKFHLYVCSAAALRRGVVDDIYAKKFNLSVYNLQYGFKLSSLGYLAQVVLTCDRFIQF